MATITSLYSLPEKVPELASYNAMNLNSAFAIYHTIPLSPDDRAAVLADILSDSDVDAARFAVPLADFSGQDKAAVAAHHVALAQKHAPDAEWPEFHPTSIMVVDDPDWRTKGVVLVSLNADGEGSTDAFRVPAEGAALILNNIEVGNSSWEEEGDSAEEKIPQDRPAASLSQSLGGALPLSYRDGSTTLTWMGCNGQTDPYFALLGPRRKFHFGDLLDQINGREAENRGLDDCPCRLAFWVNDFEFTEGEDMEEMLMSLAKLQVEEREKYEPELFFHPRLFVWGDEDFETEGVLVCEFDLVDGKPTGLKSKSVPAERAMVELLKRAKGE